MIKPAMFMLQDISLDDLREELPERQPRYPLSFKKTKQVYTWYTVDVLELELAS